jgi:hypothetical protein
MYRKRAEWVLAAAWVLGCGARQTPVVGDAGPDARAFVAQQRPELEREINVGSGETIYQLSVIAGCQDLPALGRELRQRRHQIFTPDAPDDATVAARVVDIMSERRELRCLDLELQRPRVFSAGRRKVGGVQRPGMPPRVR